MQHGDSSGERVPLVPCTLASRTPNENKKSLGIVLREKNPKRYSFKDVSIPFFKSV